MMVGDSSIVPMPEAIATDFMAPFREADKRYVKDSKPGKSQHGTERLLAVRARVPQHPFQSRNSTCGGKQRSDFWIGYPTPIWRFISGPNRTLCRCRRSTAARQLLLPFARRKRLRNGVSRLPRLKRSLAESYPAYAVRNANGSRARKSSGRASAAISGIHSTLAGSVLDADISGKSRLVFSAEPNPHTGNGTWTIRLAVARSPVDAEGLEGNCPYVAGLTKALGRKFGKPSKCPVPCGPG